MITGLAHVCLAAKDLAETERFYCAGLGLKKAFDFIRNGRIIGFYLEVAKGSFIEVFQEAECDGRANSPIRHVCLEVDDIDGIGRALVKAGFEVTPKLLGADHSWQSWTTDPSGVRIEFHHYTASSSQITRENCVLA